MRESDPTLRHPMFWFTTNSYTLDGSRFHEIWMQKTAQVHDIARGSPEYRMMADKITTDARDFFYPSHPWVEMTPEQLNHDAVVILEQAVHRPRRMGSAPFC